MSTWLSFVVGVILGLLFGWLIELFWRRRPAVSEPADAVAAKGRAVEWTVPQRTTVPAELAGPIPGATYESDVVAQPGAEDVLVGGTVLAPVEPETADIKLQPVTTEDAASVEAELVNRGLPETPVYVAVDLEAERVEWPEISGQVELISDEIGNEPAHIAVELPVASEQLSSEQVEALAPAPVEGSRTTARDDLLRIEGIGRVYDVKLRTAGINTFAELASADEARLREIIQPQSWQRINFGDWIEQARLIAEGNEEELRALQEKLFKRKKS